MTQSDPQMLVNTLQADELSDLVYQELRQIAHHCLRREWGQHTWQTTDLLHEAWLRLAQSQGQFQSHAHFLAVAATCMQHILVDYARQQKAAKRGGRRQRVSWPETLAAPLTQLEAIADLDDALQALRRIDEQEFRIVQMHYFGAMKKTQIAAVLGVSESTVRKRLKSAQAWLLRYLETRS